jgi:hypothetical protein
MSRTSPLFARLVLAGLCALSFRVLPAAEQPPFLHINVNRPCRIQWLGQVAPGGRIEVQHLDGTRGEPLALRKDVLVEPQGKGAFAMRRVVFSGKAFSGELALMFAKGTVHYLCHVEAYAGAVRLTNGRLVGATGKADLARADDRSNPPTIQVEFP